MLAWPAESRKRSRLGQLGSLGRVAQEPRPERVGHRRHAHRRARMAGVGLLDGVHCERPDGVDGQLVQLARPLGSFVSPDLSLSCRFWQGRLAVCRRLLLARDGRARPGDPPWSLVARPLTTPFYRPAARPRCERVPCVADARAERPLPLQMRLLHSASERRLRRTAGRATTVTVYPQSRNRRS